VAIRMALLVALAASLLSSCDEGGGGGITIPESDGSPPTISFGVAEAGQGSGVTVDGGAGEKLTLRARTGSLNLAVTAKDPESGIQKVEIWMTKKTTRCQADDTCSMTGPGLASSPKFDSTEPQKSPGDTTAESSVLAQALDLPTEIGQFVPPPGGSFTVDLELWAVAVNHLGGRTQTARVTATWRE
jgi:hypothetical protein